ncbi:MAG: hypothetical protein Q9220_002045 [cf. Caloplaca sp. 1 TL-2023]
MSAANNFAVDYNLEWIQHIIVCGYLCPLMARLSSDMPIKMSVVYSGPVRRVIRVTDIAIRYGGPECYNNPTPRTTRPKYNNYRVG